MQQVAIGDLQLLAIENVQQVAVGVAQQVALRNEQQVVIGDSGFATVGYKECATGRVCVTDSYSIRNVQQVAVGNVQHVAVGDGQKVVPATNSHRECATGISGIRNSTNREFVTGSCWECTTGSSKECEAGS